MPVHCEITEGIAVVTIEGATPLNAMTYDMYTDLEEILFRRIDPDPDVRVAILVGKGPNWSVGHDMKAAQAAIEIGADREVYSPRPFWFRQFPEILSRRLHTPLIGATRGWVLGAGMCIYGIHCSIRIAGESSKFGYTELKRGLVGASAIALTSRQLPYAAHALMSATGEFIDARTALRFGFVNEVVADDRVETRALEVAAKVAANPRIAVRAEKVLLLRGEGMSQETASLLAWSTWSLDALDEELFAGIASATREDRS